MNAIFFSFYIKQNHSNPILPGQVLHVGICIVYVVQLGFSAGKYVVIDAQ
jgi:hypothetical protein